MERKWWQEEIVYQIYPKSFCDSNQDGIGDLNGIRKKLKYLKELNVTMLWICPIFKSPMDDNGYDISDYFALAPEFGTMEDLKCLIDEAKEIGIKIILDLVINHTSDEHAWFQQAITNKDSKYRDYYIFKESKEVPNNWRSIFGGSVWEKVEGEDTYYFHTFGKKQPDLNWENKEVREVLYAMVNRWLEFGIAGFRVDAITFIKKDQSYASIEADGVDGLAKCTKTCRNQEGIKDFLLELKERCFDKYDCMSVAEAPGIAYDDLDDFISKDGFFSMIFDFKAADLDVASGSEWFKRLPWKIRDLKTKLMDYQMAVQKVGWAANFIENHDQPRSTTKYLLAHERNKEAVKTLASMYLCLRGTPYIYQGQELGMVNFQRSRIEEFNDISSIDQYYRAMQEGCSKEEALHYINLRSRDNSRTPFPWNGTRYGGFSEHTPWLSMSEEYPTINAEEQMQDENSVLSFYKKILHFRQNSKYRECLIYGDIAFLESDEEIIAYERKTKKDCLQCFFNFSDQGKEETLLHVSCKVVFQTQDEVEIKDQVLKLKPFQTVILKVEEQ